MNNDFVDVTKNDPCPVCGKPDWCTYINTPDEKRIVMCRRSTAGAKRVATDGAGVFLLDGHGLFSSENHLQKPIKASLERRNAVYETLFELMDLNDEDRKDLKRRGHGVGEVLYASIPDDWSISGWHDSIIDDLLSRGLILDRVPGFYKIEDTWRANFGPGFMIPIHAPNGKITAVQIRRRNPEEDSPRYRWFSSFKYYDKLEETHKLYPRGASSGSPLHHQLNDAAASLWITESPLKADYLRFKSLKPIAVVGCAGVNAAHDEIVTAASSYERVVIAFDGDWRTNDFVRKAIESLASNLLKTNGIRPFIANWDNTCGIDDALQMGLKIKLLSLDKWLAFNYNSCAA